MGKNSNVDAVIKILAWRDVLINDEKQTRIYQVISAENKMKLYKRDLEVLAILTEEECKNLIKGKYVWCKKGKLRLLPRKPRHIHV